jgi:uncharacterized protein YndB with AHSA1/START domain
MKKTLETSIIINAPVSKVWGVFTDPTLTRQMGGEYVTDWKLGSSFSFRKTSGEEVTAGTLLKLEPEKLLQHTVLNSIKSIDATLTYKFSEQDSVTKLSGREEFAEPISDEEYTDSLEGWNAAFQAVKEIAEREE